MALKDRVCAFPNPCVSARSYPKKHPPLRRHAMRRHAETGRCSRLPVLPPSQTQATPCLVFSAFHCMAPQPADHAPPCHRCQIREALSSLCPGRLQRESCVQSGIAAAVKTRPTPLAPDTHRIHTGNGPCRTLGSRSCNTSQMNHSDR